MPIRLGAGPVTVYRDASIVYYADIIKELRGAAERSDVPYQHSIFEHYGIDCSSMVVGGARPNLFCVPCRYSHSPVEMIHLGEVKNLVKLRAHYVAA